MSAGPPPIVGRSAAPPARSTPRRPRRALLLLAGLLVLAAGAGLRLAPGTPETPTPPTPAVRPALTARGRVQPAQQARIGTLAGGVVTRLAVAPGDHVAEGQEVARVRLASGASEVLTAPWSGTITTVPANLGDTVTPGSLIATLGDLSRLRVETTDVDEFIISQVRAGGRVLVAVDALDRRELPGYVATVALQPTTAATGDEHYPVTIELLDADPGLRPGMSVRITFQE